MPESKRTREVRSAGSIARSYFAWLLISGFFSYLLSFIVAFAITRHPQGDNPGLTHLNQDRVSRPGDRPFGGRRFGDAAAKRPDPLAFLNEESGSTNSDAIALAVLSVGLFAIVWFWVGWWYGGRKISRYYVFQNHADVLNYLALFSIVLALMSFAIVIRMEWRKMEIDTILTAFSVVSFVFGLVIWAAVWYGLGWMCLPHGWPRECQQLMEDGEFQAVVDLLTIVGSHQKLSPEDERTLDLARQRSKNAGASVGDGGEPRRPPGEGESHPHISQT